MKFCEGGSISVGEPLLREWPPFREKADPQVGAPCRQRDEKHGLRHRFRSPGHYCSDGEHRRQHAPSRSHESPMLHSERLRLARGPFRRDQLFNQINRVNNLSFGWPTPTFGRRSFLDQFRN